MRALRLAIALCVFALLARWGLWGVSIVHAASGPAYVVVVHPHNPAAVVDRKFLGDAFLKKATEWPGGETIHPVDLRPGAQARRGFTEDVLKRTVEAVRLYWQQRIFAGRDLPPPELDTDDAVIGYVSKHEGAVGYVAAGADLKGTKPLEIR